LGSLPTFAAAAHEISAKSEGERRQCGLFRLSLQLRNWIGLKAITDTKGGNRTFAATGASGAKLTEPDICLLGRSNQGIK
jgi:hypothetical protein